MKWSQLQTVKKSEWATEKTPGKKKIEIVLKEYKNKYVYHEATLKQYGDDFKIIYQAMKPAKGISRNVTRGSGEKKLEESISRSKSKIKEYALCNEWKYFVTLTLDKEKVNRYSLQETYLRISQMIKDINKKYNCKIAYMLIPEKHKDGAWHFHGFMNDIPEKELKESKKRSKTRKLFNWISYSRKFGFNDIEEIENKDKATSYIMKYISKDMALSVSEINAKTYYCSRGLKHSVEIKRGRVSAKYQPQFEKIINDNVVYSVMNLPRGTTIEQAKSYLQSYNEESFQSICDGDGVLLEKSIPLEWI